jgi:hypothetical protein
MKTIRNDALCPSCSKVNEVQGLGITKYSDPDATIENNTLADNVAGVYTFIPKNKISWVPYDIGYYAETKVKSFSEFWFNDGGPTHDKTLNENIFNFSAAHAGSKNALLQWQSNIDAQINIYVLQRADASLAFQDIGTVNSIHNIGNTYNYIDSAVRLTGNTVFYRIKYILNDGTEHYSIIRALSWEGQPGVVMIYPNPVSNGELHLRWFKGNGDGLQWSMTDLSGKRLFSNFTNDNTFDGEHVFKLNQMALSSGMYILNVISGKEKWTFKIVYQQ